MRRGKAGALPEATGQIHLSMPAHKGLLISRALGVLPVPTESMVMLPSWWPVARARASAAVPGLFANNPPSVQYPRVGCWYGGKYIGAALVQSAACKTVVCAVLEPARLSRVTGVHCGSGWLAEDVLESWKVGTNTDLA